MGYALSFSLLIVNSKYGLQNIFVQNFQKAVFNVKLWCLTSKKSSTNKVKSIRQFHRSKQKHTVHNTIVPVQQVTIFAIFHYLCNNSNVKYNTIV